jgi:hypothetical protein
VAASLSGPERGFPALHLCWHVDDLPACVTCRWFPQSATSDTHTYGLPWVYCPDIQPRFQVAHRCRCRNWDVCGQHQVAVQQCVLKKRTGYENLPDEHVSSVMNQAALIMAERSRLTST